MKNLEKITKTIEKLVENIELHKEQSGFLKAYELYKRYAIKQGIHQRFFETYDNQIKEILK